MKLHININKLFRYSVVFSFIVACALLVNNSIQANAQSTLVCDPQIYYGVKHCTDDGGITHILLVDINDSHVRLETVLPMGPNGECNSVNTTLKDPTSNCPYPYPLETVKSMLERYRSRGAVAAINTDYFALNQDHGAQGLAVKSGVRLDGPEHGVTTDIPYNFPSLAISAQKDVIIGIPGSNEIIAENISTTYYTTVAGAPIIVGGESYGNNACSENVYPGLKCTQLSQSAAGIMPDGRLVFITAQKDATGLANYLTQNYQVHTALKFDGGGSASIAWLDENDVAQGYYSDPTSSRAIAEGLLIFSERIQEINTVDVALIIDSSGSMTWNDPTNLRKEAAKVFVDTMQDDDQVAIVDFDYYTRVPFPLNLVGGNRDTIRSAINTIDSSGGTNIGAGLQAGYNQLVASTMDNRKAAVMLTDGVGSYADQALLYQAKGWPVYTVGLGSDTDEALLQRIASETGGRYFKLDSPSQLANVYFEIATLVAQGEIVATYSDTMTLGSLWEIVQTILTNLKSVFFFVTWPGSEVSMTLIAPDGTIIDPATTDPNVYHAKGLTYELYRIDNPIPGNWTIRMYGTDLPAEGELVTLQVSTVAEDTTNLPPTILPLDEAIVQYSDPLDFQIFATDTDDLVESLTFNITGLPVGITFTDNGDGSATISGIVTNEPGIHDIEISVSDPGGLTDTVILPMIIIQEDARITYTGPMLVSTPCSDCSTVTVPLRATIQDITAVLDDPAYDAYPGDITHATVTFINRENNTVLCSAPVMLFDPSDPTTGTAYCEWVADIGANDGYDFNLGILLDGYYTRNSTADDVIVVVSKPSTNSVTGGGYLLNQSTAGTYAGDLDLRTHFGFNIKFINNRGRGQSIVGRATVIARHDGHIYRIRTNALDSLIVVPATNDDPAVGEFYSKASIEDVTDPNNPILITTQAILNFTMTDYEDASGQYRDLLGISVWAQNGSLLFSSNWTGTQTIEQAIEAGNLEIHQFTSQPR